MLCFVLSCVRYAIWNFTHPEIIHQNLELLNVNNIQAMLNDPPTIHDNCPKQSQASVGSHRWDAMQVSKMDLRPPLSPMLLGKTCDAATRPTTWNKTPLRNLENKQRENINLAKTWSTEKCMPVQKLPLKGFSYSYEVLLPVASPSFPSCFLLMPSFPSCLACPTQRHVGHGGLLCLSKKRAPRPPKILSSSRRGRRNHQNRNQNRLLAVGLQNRFQCTSNEQQWTHHKASTRLQSRVWSISTQCRISSWGRSNFVSNQCCTIPRKSRGVAAVLACLAMWAARRPNSWSTSSWECPVRSWRNRAPPTRPHVRVTIDDGLIWTG